MRSSQIVARGAAAGLVAAVVQAGVGALQSRTLLPPGENANLAPRLMARLAARAGGRLSTAQRWSLGTVYHHLYGAGWGVLYGAVRERRPVDPLIGGLLLGATIYGITFPRAGGAVRLDAERPPQRRSRRMECVLLSITGSFGLTAAYAYERLRSSR